MKVFSETGKYIKVTVKKNKWSNRKPSEDEWLEVIAQINRHVDNIEPLDSTDIVVEGNQVCSFCGSEWTAQNDITNGCCSADVYGENDMEDFKNTSDVQDACWDEES